MRRSHLYVVVVASMFASGKAAAQPPPAPSPEPAGASSALPPAPPPPPPEPAVAPPPPAPGDVATASPSLAEAADLTGAPNPSALAPSAGDEWRFSSHGFIRAPMRVGMGKRPPCGAGMASGTSVGGANGTSAPCAGPNESTTNFHSPMVPDDQYLDWRFTRQQERDWAELFFNYGNSKVAGTVSLQGFHFTDAAFNDTAAQFGIAQAYVTVTPDLGSKFRVQWRVGSFWDKYGMAGIYDAGKYDTYMFGRTHLMGETLSAEYDVGDWTLKAAHGFGTKSEQWAFQYPPIAPNGSPAVALPGFTLANHFHAGAVYKRWLEVNAHYMVAWSQDSRAIVGVDVSNHDVAGPPDGSIAIAGAEARVRGGVFGTLYAAFSNIQAKHAEVVGPAFEVVHALGGGGARSGNGLLDNYLGACTSCSVDDTGVGSIATVSVQYDYSFGLLYRKLQNRNTPGFWGEGTDVTLSLFGMYTTVTSKDVAADGVKKLKYGADLVYAALPFLGFGVRADVVQPSSKDTTQSFWVVSPKVMIHTKWVTHEEITLQYSRYGYGTTVTPQFPNGAPLIGSSAVNYPPDENVFGLKCTLWW